MQVSGTSPAELRRVAAKLRKAHAKDLTDELRRGQRKAFAPLQKKVKASALFWLPKRGGYAALMAKDVKVTILTRTFGRIAVTAHVFARGKGKENRDLVAREAGNLRHPDIRDLRKPRKARVNWRWHDQRIPREFVGKAARDLPDDVLKESADALERVLQRLARG